MGGGPGTAVELAFDAVDRKIAMRPCDPDKKNAFRVAQSSAGTHRVVYAGAFLTHFNIHPAHTVLFDDVQFARGQDHDPRPRERDAGGERK